MENEEHKEKEAQKAIKKDAIRQMKETSGWRYTLEWINKELDLTKEKMLNPGCDSWDSYIYEKGKYQGIFSLLI